MLRIGTRVRWTNTLGCNDECTHKDTDEGRVLAVGIGGAYCVDWDNDQPTIENHVNRLPAPGSGIEIIE